MTDADMAWAAELDGLGLSTELLGPTIEWAPVDRKTFQLRHQQFWKAVSDILPEHDDDEAYWMTEAAALRLTRN